MDVLAELLDGPRARGAFLLRSVLAPPWSVRIADRAPLTLVHMVRADAWITTDDGRARLVRPGDIAVIRGPEPYVIAGDRETPPRIIITPDQVSTDTAGEELCERMDLGVRTWGDDRAAAAGTGDPAAGTASASAVMISGTYRMRGEISSRLLSALPQVLVLPGDAWSSPLPSLLNEEIVRDEPGQEVVLDRLLDLLLIAVLRTWFARPEAAAPAWYAAQGDAVVGPALRLLHNRPAHPWTVADLAARTGVSRAALGRRFTELVGEPPMAYLTGWRLALAADLLREPDATVASVARRVGYGSPFALSAAFKRVRGISPQQHRERTPAAL